MDETTPAPQASSKKWLWIAGGVIILILIGAAVTGFGGRGTSLGSAYFAPGTDVEQNTDGTVTYTGDQGSVTVGAGASLPENWPKDAPPPYSGASIIYSGNSNPTTGEEGSAIVYNTNGSVDSVVEYYTARLKAEGWKVEGSGKMSSMTILTATKDTRTFGAYLADNGQGQTSVTVGIQF